MFEVKTFIKKTYRDRLDEKRARGAEIRRRLREYDVAHPWSLVDVCINEEVAERVAVDCEDKFVEADVREYWIDGKMKGYAVYKRTHASLESLRQHVIRQMKEDRWVQSYKRNKTRNHV